MCPPAKRDEPHPTVLLVPALDCASRGMAAHIPSSHCFGGWMWRWWHWEAARTLPGLWHPHGLSLQGEGTCLSPALCDLVSKGKSLQFTSLKSCSASKLAWAPR